MASSLQLEISSNVELANIGAVVRLAVETAPTKAEALTSKGHVSVSIPADGTRKISISQHYTTNFDDGLTLADVLTPNTAYKLYLYFPAELITTTAKITGLNIINDKAIVPFTTTALPAEGDAKWLSNIGSKCVGSLDTYYFMQEQTGFGVCYFYTNFNPLAVEIITRSNNAGVIQIHGIGKYDGTSEVPVADFHFTYGSISGYTSNPTSNYAYWVGADKERIIEDYLNSTIIDPLGIPTVFKIAVTRH
ncbi:hypothetical protein P0082_05270 [Candidatus Haliotispira prima]|uniref:Uncharacterized protein n=1 Tax=Candidatus Haliotispira prima TaxID=3034016 RepID=A0ABY8MKD3_9SPIO|nr:hypothetical protein P0082_05270 [Candidatus Haliotispira prima]